MQNTSKNKIECKTVVEDPNIIGTQRKGCLKKYLFGGEDQKRTYKEIGIFEQDLKGNFTSEGVTW